MNRLLRVAETLQYRLGIAGTAGLLIALACLIASVLLVIPMHHTLQQLSTELTRLQAQPRNSPPVLMLDDAQQLANFYQQFPSVNAMSGILEQIHQLALEQGIGLSSGEYKLANDANNPRLARYEIIFPLQANYARLRAFIEAAALRFPSLGLSEINIKREAIDESGAQIKLHYFLLMNKE